MGIPEGVRVTNSTGVKATMVSEHAMMLLLALLRQLPECQAHQRARLYTRQETNAKLRTLEDATVCVFGRGAIGRELVDWLLSGKVADDFRQFSHDRFAQGNLFVQSFGGNRG